MNCEFTEDDRKAILSLVNENELSVLGSESMKRFQGLYFTAMKRMEQAVRSTARENALMKQRCRKFEKNELEMAARGEFEGRGLDSVMVASAILYCLQRLNTENAQITMQKLQYLLYDVYANYLARYNKRLTIEGPVAYGYTDKATGKDHDEGPRFWRMSKQMHDIVLHRITMTQAHFDALDAVDHEAAGIVWGVVRKHYADKEADLLRWIKSSDAYKYAHKRNNGGKWGKEIPDALIFSWKREQMGLPVSPDKIENK